jgi:hypothetical protein
MRSLDGILMPKEQEIIKKNPGCKKKASDQEITSAYIKLKSCKKVAKLLGMCPQSIHERLVKLEINIPKNILTDEEKELISKFYHCGFKTGDGKLKAFAEDLGRTQAFICRYAKSQGLTNLKRILCEDQKKNSIAVMKKWHQENDHPKGMLGKNHSPEYCKEIGIRAKKWHLEASDEAKSQRAIRQVTTARKNGSLDRKHGSWKSDWRTIGDKTKFFRSRWEANYARYLEFLKLQGQILDWLHEPQTFWFLEIMRGSRSYLPDFKVMNLDGSHYWVEVKGWMDDRSKTKLKRFAKYYPNEKLELIQAAWFKKNNSMMKNIIDGWELGERE